MFHFSKRHVSVPPPYVEPAETTLSDLPGGYATPEEEDEEEDHDDEYQWLPYTARGLDLLTEDGSPIRRSQLQGGGLHGLLGFCTICAGCALCCCAVFFGIAIVSAKKMLEPQGAALNSALIEPPDYPRSMACGYCGAGKKTNQQLSQCVEPCFGLDYVLQWELLAKNHHYEAVKFPSRPGPRGEPAVTLSAWWLPGDSLMVAPNAVAAPRIVVMHGRGGNANDCSVQSTCFLLRSMGFSCLTPNARDAGTSGSSTHPDYLTAGYDYAMDVLGAWDYAVQDPDGLLGGALPPGKVGIMGPQAVAIAFGLERKMSGVWLDSALFRGLDHAIDDSFSWLGFLAPLISGPTKFFAHRFSGGTVDYYDPLELLKNCSSEKRRKVAISQGSLDNVYSIAEANSAIDVVGGLPNCYEVDVFLPPEDCDGVRHRTEAFQYPDHTRKKLCRFWSYVFKEYNNTCGLDSVSPLERFPPSAYWKAHT
eukprot:TRINITY_DN90485_c0_g1_i1.p1 TRINITY_DN90485_c0_g1~~TRINITY_DN90485_c0_g1_i1.p1  ORF type:complete len:477 (-),score=51.28 TRINITY_DN90485_c0_g1_i1:150-1580(-)